ncbi:MAG: S8 family peptidase [Bacillota bacterium]
MKNKKRYPIIGKGEVYIEPVRKKQFGGPKNIPYTYDQAKERMIGFINNIENEITTNSNMFLDEKVVCVRMEPKFEAKSYMPTSLLLSDQMEIIGGRKYDFIDNNNATVTGSDDKAKLYFMKVTDKGLLELKNVISKGTKDNLENWRNQIGSIHSLDLLSPDEKVMGIDDDWVEGIVELIIHPMDKYTNQAIQNITDILEIPVEEMAIRTYERGITFISVKCSKNTIDKIKFYNPLRAIHPLGQIQLPSFRGINNNNDAPQPPTERNKSSVLVGVFDGGVNEEIPLLKNYINSYNLVNSKPHDDYISHGTAVCGAVLYGPLNHKNNTDTLNTPKVSVESFRVLPIDSTDDFESAIELYQAIDCIENVVKERPDIKIFNLSFGPRGAIIDDSISRFTYVMDKLTYEASDGINPIFCVAVGNDGNFESPFNRIQAPSDMVNGLGIGSYTYGSDGKKTRATYSCVGTGREGCKVKPDLLEFGGSREHPVILVSKEHGKTIPNTGTSFSSPIVAGKIGHMLALSENLKPHMARNLLIHSVDSEEDNYDIETGYGFCPSDVEDILMCNDKKVTVLYEGEIMSAQSIKLPIFIPSLSDSKGNVTITWTITTVVNPNMNDTDSYTNNCIEDTFYPNDLVFNFSKNGSKPKKLNLGTPEDALLAKSYIEQGYKRSDLPASKPGKVFLDEEELRSKYLKWDTVVKKRQSMRVKSLLNPFIVLHGMGRNGYETSKIKYFVAITVEIPKYSGNLYDSILQNYKNLVPVEIRNINKIMVPVK